MFVKVDENKNLEIVWISAELYKKYEQQKRELETCEYYLKKAQKDKGGFRDALRKISSYSGDNEDALKLKRIADKPFIDFDYDYCINTSRGNWTELDDFIDKIVIDLGCGWGVNSRVIANKARLIYSIDKTLERLNFHAIINQKMNFHNIVPIKGDVTDLPIKSNSIDRFIIFGLLEYANQFYTCGSGRERQLRFLKYIKTYLREDGAIWIGIENQFSFLHFLGITAHGEIPFTPLLPKPLLSLIYKIFNQKLSALLWSKKGITDLLKQAGYSKISIYYAYPDYRFPLFIFSSDKKMIISKYVDSFIHNKFIANAIGFLDKLGIIGHIFPSFIIRAAVK